MALIVNGVTIPSSGVVTCNGVALSSIVCNAVEVWKKGTLTLKEVVFNASGTFTMPSGVVNNQVIVGCTGGGGGGGYDFDSGGYVYTGSGGGGSGRTYGTFTLTPNQAVTVTIGAGGAYAGGTVGSNGGSSSFGSYISCTGGYGGNYATGGSGVSGGGNGSSNGIGGQPASATSSSVPAMLTLASGATDNTNKLYTAKSYSGGSGYNSWGSGGGGCYGVGASGGSGSVPPTSNSGAGSATTMAGASAGKVVVYYYVYE